MSLCARLLILWSAISLARNVHRFLHTCAYFHITILIAINLQTDACGQVSPRFRSLTPPLPPSKLRPSWAASALRRQLTKIAVCVPHHNYPLDSSVAATIGSPSYVASDTWKDNTFRIYPNDESETDRLVTKALVFGDFKLAVSLCVFYDRFAVAILLAVKGDPLAPRARTLSVAQPGFPQLCLFQ